MKAIVIAFAILAICQAQYLYHDSPTAESNTVSEFIKGFFAGIHETTSVDELYKCIPGTSEIIAKIKAALEEMGKFTAEVLIEGLHTIVQQMHELEAALRPCLEKFDQFKKLIAEIDQIDINTMVKKIIDDPMKFLGLLLEAARYFGSEQYELAGESFGAIMYGLFLEPITPEMDPITLQMDPMLFMRGFVMGVGEPKGPDGLWPCIRNTNTPISTMVDGIRLIANMHPVGVIRGVGEVITGLAVFFNVLNGCLGGYDRLNDIRNHLGADVNNIVNKILNDRSPYLYDIAGCLTSLSANNFILVGKYMGTLIVRMLY